MKTDKSYTWYEIHEMDDELDGWVPDYSEVLASYEEDETDTMFQDALDLSKDRHCPLCILEVIDENRDDGSLEYNIIWDNID